MFYFFMGGLGKGGSGKEEEEVFLMCAYCFVV